MLLISLVVHVVCDSVSIGNLVNLAIYVSEKQVNLTIKEMAAQSFVFIIAGFETSASVLTSCFYELAINQDIQKKLTDELDSAGNDITYDVLQQLPYLEMVVCGKIIYFFMVKNNLKLVIERNLLQV